MAENEQAGWSGGFDVVLGNPPWERIKIQEKEWFATRHPDIANAGNAAQRRQLISALAYEDQTLYKAYMEDQRQAAGESHLVLDSGRYPLCGRGDVNTYSIFAETMRLIISPVGRVGCIVPSGIATDDTTKFFFQNLMDLKSLVSLYDFDNRGKLFPAVMSLIKFCLLTLTGSARPATKGAEFMFFAHKVEDLQENAFRFTLSAEDLALINPNTRTCPILRSKHDLELTKAIYSRIPILLKEGHLETNLWEVNFSTMFHMANDSHLFRSYEQLEVDGWILEGNIFYKEGEACLPLYEGKMIWHFDHRLSGHEDSEIDRLHHNNPFMLSMPRYWVHQSYMPNIAKDDRKALLAFRDIARSTDARTAIFDIIPIVPCSHTLVIVMLDTEYTRNMVYLAACTSSFVFDYITRQKLGGAHMTFFILKQLPMLPPKQYIAKCKWYNRASLGDWMFPALSNSPTQPGTWNLSPKTAATMIHLSVGMINDVSCCAASLMRLIFTYMVSNAMMWIILWRRFRL